MSTKAQAIAQAERHMDRRWAASATAALVKVAERQPTLTSDEVWDAMRGTLWSHLPTEPRWMGCIFIQAQAAGRIRPTGAMRPSTYSVNHHRRITVWRSLIYGKE